MFNTSQLQPLLFLREYNIQQAALWVLLATVDRLVWPEPI